MKYGEHLKSNIAPEYGKEPYLNYDVLDNIIRDLSQVAPSGAVLEGRQVSLTTPAQTYAQQGLTVQSTEVKTDEDFCKYLEEEMVKVESFTLKKVTELRLKLRDVEKLLENRETKLDRRDSTMSNLSNKGGSIIDTHDAGDAEDEQTEASSNEEISALADEVADDFLRLEKYVNINFMGFHKILKKHDKWLPNNPCKEFYVNRMHAQAWVRGDYSDLVVRLSHIYSTIRDDHVVQDPDEDANQSFLRSTTKYWVKTEDVSRVKYAILRHLPVFLQRDSTGKSDSQFTNSVYIDNDQLELYHGRLDKTPGAIALRLRWYGTGDAKTVFVERKTHNEKWVGGVSVKERFIIDESEVQQVLTNTYPIEKKKQELLKSGKTQKEADEWETLVREITQVVSSKQLVPTMRTQCMRTAFQIPFDATVRISLDTNLCMISERGYDLQDMKVWHRDPKWVLEPNEITRFPHAILEVKLQLSGGNMTPPQWVTNLQNSGWLYECHKYSKYVHGCAVLLPEELRSVPYWVDDVSLRESIIASGGSRILANEGVGIGPGANAVYDHLLPFGDMTHDRRDTAVGRTAASVEASKGHIQRNNSSTMNDIGRTNSSSSSAAKIASRKLLVEEGIDFYGPSDIMMADHNAFLESIDDEDDNCCDCRSPSWMFSFCSRDNAYYEMVVAPTSIQKIEPKLFLANERTFLHWLQKAVMLSSIASTVLAFSDANDETWGTYYAMAILPLSLIVIIYALNVYLWRMDRIKTRIPGRWDDPVGPMMLGAGIALLLSINLFTTMYEITKVSLRIGIDDSITLDYNMTKLMNGA